MCKAAFMFPGQGVQFTGLGQDFYKKYEASRKIYEEASDVVDLDVSKLCFERNEQLNKTEFTQIAIFVTEIAI